MSRNFESVPPYDGGNNYAQSSHFSLWGRGGGGDPSVLIELLPLLPLWRFIQGPFFFFLLGLCTEAQVLSMGNSVLTLFSGVFSVGLASTHGILLVLPWSCNLKTNPSCNLSCLFIDLFFLFTLLFILSVQENCTKFVRFSFVLIFILKRS